MLTANVNLSVEVEATAKMSALVVVEANVVEKLVGGVGAAVPKAAKAAAANLA